MNTSAKTTFEKRRVGTTNLEMTTLGLGGATLASIFQPVPDEQARATVAHAIDAGIGYFDTAPQYGFGRSEHLMGDALRFRQEGKVISTKVGRLLRPVRSDAERTYQEHAWVNPFPFDMVYDYSYDAVMRSFEDSLQRLGLPKVDILYVHDIGPMTHGVEGNKPLWKQLETGGYKALNELKSAGLISAIGLGVNEWEVCEAAMAHGRFDCFLLAGRYTLLEQSSLDTFMPKCERHGATLIIGGAYNSGILATGTWRGGVPHYNYAPASEAIIERVRRIEAICEAHGVTLAAAALQFPLAHPLVSSVIPGLGSPSRVTQTMALFDEPIPPAFWHDLKAQELLRDDAPTPNGVG